MRALWIVGGLVLAQPAGAEELSADQIVDRALQKNAFGFDNAVAHISLKLVAKDGPERSRAMVIQSLDRNGQSKSLVRFMQPADVAGTAFLVLEKAGGDDEQYLYLPALGKVKRITASQRNQRFMGTDMTYADLESRNLRKAKSTRRADGDVGGNPAYIIESLPLDLADSQYGRTVTWIHKTAFVPLKVEFYDKESRLLKTLTVRRLQKIDDAWIAMESQIENVQTQTRTDMVVTSLDTKAQLKDADFTQEALKGG